MLHRVQSAPFERLAERPPLGDLAWCCFFPRLQFLLQVLQHLMGRLLHNVAGALQGGGWRHPRGEGIHIQVQRVPLPADVFQLPTRSLFLNQSIQVAARAHVAQ